MRLTSEEIDAIRQAAAEAFGASVVVRLFGSRVDDARRGGDIDLHFEVDPGADTEDNLDLFEERLFARIDPQRVDTLFSVRGCATGVFEQIAYRDGRIL